MIKIIEGIVLKNSDYQEKSKIIRILTKEHGILGVYLKGANDFKNRNYALAQPFTHALFNVNYNPNGLSSSFTGDIINAFNKIKLDYNKNIYATHLFELLLRTLEQNNPVPYLYDLLVITLNEINQTSEQRIIETLTFIFELKLMYFLGISPQIDYCVDCQSIEQIVNFDIHKGGFVCTKCQDFRSRQFSLETLMLIRELYYYDHNQISDLKIPNELPLKELRLLLTDYFYTHLGVKTNSIKYF